MKMSASRQWSVSIPPSDGFSSPRAKIMLAKYKFHSINLEMRRKVALHMCEPAANIKDESFTHWPIS